MLRTVSIDFYQNRSSYHSRFISIFISILASLSNASFILRIVTFNFSTFYIIRLKICGFLLTHRFIFSMIFTFGGMSILAELSEIGTLTIFMRFLKLLVNVSGSVQMSLLYNICHSLPVTFNALRIDFDQYESFY